MSKIKCHKNWRGCDERLFTVRIDCNGNRIEREFVFEPPVVVVFNYYTYSSSSTIHMNECIHVSVASAAVQS